MIESTTPSKLRVLHPKKLLPPKEVLDRYKKKKQERLSKIPIVHFFKVFFGEGF